MENRNMGWYSDYKVKVSLKNIPSDEQVEKWLAELKTLRSYHYAQKYIDTDFNFWCGLYNLKIVRNKNSVIVTTTIKYGSGKYLVFLGNLIHTVLNDFYTVMVGEADIDDPDRFDHPNEFFTEKIIRSSSDRNFRKSTQKPLLCNCSGSISHPDQKIPVCT